MESNSCFVALPGTSSDILLSSHLTPILPKHSSCFDRLTKSCFSIFGMPGMVCRGLVSRVAVWGEKFGFGIRSVKITELVGFSVLLAEFISYVARPSGRTAAGNLSFFLGSRPAYLTTAFICMGYCLPVNGPLQWRYCCHHNPGLQSSFHEYTETHSKLGIVARRRLGVKSGLPVPKQLNSNELSDAGRLKSNGCRRSQNPSFECVSVYTKKNPGWLLNLNLVVTLVGAATEGLFFGMSGSTIAAGDIGEIAAFGSVALLSISLSAILAELVAYTETSSVDGVS